MLGFLVNAEMYLVEALVLILKLLSGIQIACVVHFSIFISPCIQCVWSSQYFVIMKFRKKIGCSKLVLQRIYKKK